MTAHRIPLLGSVALALTGLLVGIAAPGAAATSGGVIDPASRTVADNAVGWLRTQQQPDGGFEVAHSPGFETPDAALAIAEAAQPGSVWSATAARDAVSAVRTNGKSALDWLDAYAAGPINAGSAAKLVVLTAEPLGLNPASYDPKGDGAPVDLVAIVDAGAHPDGTYGSFNATLYAALAKRLTGGAVPATTITSIRGAQQANGGWGFAGDPAGTSIDPDTTGLAVQALVAGGATGTDPAIVKALGFLAANQGADGSWGTPFDTPVPGNPNSTALAILGVSAAGYDPTSSCWRDTVAPSRLGTPYASPDAYLRGKQTAAGNIASPSDQFGLNTFATSQAVEGLLRSWLPVVSDVTHVCPAGAPTPTTTTTPALVGSESTGAATPAASAEDGGTSSGELPRTGTGATLPLALVGAASCATGAAMVRGARRARIARG